MIKLILFELDKLCRKRSFILAMAGLLLVNVFLLWYTSLPDSTTPGLSAYKALLKDLEPLSEEDKQTYIQTLYEDIQGIQLVNDVQNYQAAGNDMGEVLAKQAMADNPGVYEKYHKDFLQGDYLHYTDSLAREYALIGEIWEEASKVWAYDTYLEEIQDRKDTLLGISVFSSKNVSDFSKRNIEKEARDYEELGGITIRYFPSKGFALAVKPGITDLLLLLSVFLFSCGLIFEEKEKKLFYITRAALLGRWQSILAKLTALAIHCMGAAALFYCANLLFFGATAGVGDLFRSIQSVACFMESPLNISTGTYLLLMIVTKAAVLFLIGCIIVFAAIISKQIFTPFLAGIGLLASGVLLYVLVPSYVSVNWLKYLNFIGLLKTENLYGGYLNFNLFGHPFSRLSASWIVLGTGLILGCGGCVLAFLKCIHPELVRSHLPALKLFKPHGNLYRHEGYKIFIMNRGIVVLLLFSALLGYEHLSKSYTLTPSEQYYRSIMLQLEGELTPEKSELIALEQQKYEAAFAQMDRIDALEASGEIDEQTANSMKTPYYTETAFYPSFCKVLKHYENILDSGGSFVYDTGYLILFGQLDNHNTEDFILLTACILLAFGSVFSMEDQKKSWNLLAATVRGRRQIIRCKVVLSILASLSVCIVLWVSRCIQITRSFPLRRLWAGLSCITGNGAAGQAGTAVGNVGGNWAGSAAGGVAGSWAGSAAGSAAGSWTGSAVGSVGILQDLPLFLWVGVMLMVQFLTVLVMVLFVLWLSKKLKNYVQALFVGGLVLLVPQILSAMGLSFARWFTLYPLYDLVNSILP